MYTAEQIRNKTYVPDTSECSLKDIEFRIILADTQTFKSIKVALQYLYKDLDDGINSTVLFFKSKGYNVRELEFLGTKYLEISW